MHVRGTSAYPGDSPALSWPDTAKDIKRKGPGRLCQEKGEYKHLIYWKSIVYIDIKDGV